MTRAALNGGEVLVATLRSRGVDAAFFVPGGTYVTVLEALSRRADEIRCVPMRLESSAALAAEAHAALTRRPACVLVSRGPGASNAVIGVHAARQSSRPMLLVVASIPRAQKQREAFQEIDFVTMFGPVAKAVFEVASFDEIGAVTARALDLTVSGCPGPVVLVVAKDILDGRTGPAAIPPAAEPPRAGVDPAGAAAAARLLDAARRPIVIAGEMVAFERAFADLAEFAHASGAPVMSAYRMQDVLCNDHPAWAGQLTLNRTPHIRAALAACDLVVAAGTRMDSVTTADYRILEQGAPLVMIHPQPETFSAWQPAIGLAAPTGAALRAIAAETTGPPPPSRLAWRDDLHAAETAHAAPGEVAATGAVDLARVVTRFADIAGEDAIVVSDAGTFGRWLHRHYRHRRPDTALGPVSGGMGCGVPGGIGAAIADPARAVFVWVGDGGFLMTGQEAATIVQEELPVVIVVCDNSAWGSILVHQQKRFPGWDFGTRLRSPDFARLAEGYGMSAFTVRRTADFGPALEAALAARPALLHLVLDPRDASPFTGATR